MKNIVKKLQENRSDEAPRISQQARYYHFHRKYNITFNAQSTNVLFMSPLTALSQTITYLSETNDRSSNV